MVILVGAIARTRDWNPGYHRRIISRRSFYGGFFIRKHDLTPWAGQAGSRKARRFL